MANELKTNNAFGKNKETLELVIDWTSSTGGASTTSSADIGFIGNLSASDVINSRYLVKAQTVPDATTAPTANYDVVVNDENGEDIFEGALGDRSATAAETVFPVANDVPAVVPIIGDLSVAVTNAGDTKKGKVILTIE